MEIEILNSHETSQELSAFFEQSANAGLFHFPKFLNYHSPEKFPLPDYQPCHFIFRDEKKIIGFIPGTIVNTGSQGKVYRTPFASSYGGLVFSESLVFSEYEEIFGLFLSHLSKVVSQVEFSPVCEFHAYSSGEKVNYQHFFLLKNQFQIAKTEMVLAVRKNSELPLEKRFHKKTQTELKQALSGELELQITDTVDEHTYEMLVECKKRLGGEVTHSFADLKKLTGLFPGKIKTFKARLQGETVAAIICFEVSKQVLNTFYIFDDIKFRNHKPNHFNYYHVLKYAFENGFEFVDFGPGTAGFTPNYSLIFFKEKFDSMPYLRTVYTKIFS